MLFKKNIYNFLDTNGDSYIIVFISILTIIVIVLVIVHSYMQTISVPIRNKKVIINMKIHFR